MSFLHCFNFSQKSVQDWTITFVSTCKPNLHNILIWSKFWISLDQFSPQFLVLYPFLETFGSVCIKTKRWSKLIQISSKMDTKVEIRQINPMFGSFCLNLCLNFYFCIHWISLHQNKTLIQTNPNVFKYAYKTRYWGANWSKLIQKLESNQMN